MKFENTLRMALVTGAIVLTAVPAKAGGFFESLFGGQAERVLKGEKHSVKDHSGGVLASWYGGGPKQYEPNAHTANGERFNSHALTVAHRTLPFGTRVLLSYGGRSVVARVNDRGPAAWTGRSLDVSKEVAQRLGFVNRGTAHLAMSVVSHD